VVRKSLGSKELCRFKSGRPHHISPNNKHCENDLISLLVGTAALNPEVANTLRDAGIAGIRRSGH